MIMLSSFTYPNKFQHVSVGGPISIGTSFGSMDTFVEQSTKTYAFHSNYSHLYSRRPQSMCIMIRNTNISKQLLSCVHPRIHSDFSVSLDLLVDP